MNPIGKILRVVHRGPAIPAPYRAAKRHVPTLCAKSSMEAFTAMGSSIPFELKSIVQQRTGSLIGCPW